MFAPRIRFVDVETTGTDPGRDRITEVGVVSVDRDGGQLRVTEWSTLVNPGRPIPPEIRWLTGIDDAMVRDAPPFERIAADLYDRFEDSIFVAHNARFDYGFIKAEFARAGIAWNTRMLCTVRLSRRLFPDRGSHSLDAIVARFGLDEEGRHRALGDARLLWRFVQKVHDRVPPAHIESAVRSLLVRPGLPVALPDDALDRIPAAPGVYIMTGAAGRTLYIGKSIDLKTRVAAHFTGDAGAERSAQLAREVEAIDWERCSGEIGALLRESQLVKTRLPEHNVRLRRRQAQGALRLDGARPRWVRASALPERPEDEHYGPFASRAAARKAIDHLAREQGLCLKAMGLERGAGGRGRRGAASGEPAGASGDAGAGAPCFNFQLRRCLGACTGAEAPEAHAARLREAMEPWRLPAWPHDGAVAIIERSDGEAADGWHVFDRWRWIGTAATHADALALAAASGAAPFDGDEFAIVREALARAQRGELELMELGSAG